MLNTIETSLANEKVTYEKNNCLVHPFSLIVICSLFLLVVISSNCYYCYTKHWLKNANVLSHYIKYE